MTYTTDRLSTNELLNILAVSGNATAIYTTEDIVIETANDKMIAAWQKDRSVIGKTIEEALPEMKGQPFFDILKNVWQTGVTYTAISTPADIETNGRMQRYYFDFEYRAIKKPDGSMLCILHTSHDVTDMVRQTYIIKANELEMLKLNKELARTNHNLAESNHELHLLNENLFAAQKDMSAMYARLSASEQKFRTVAEQIPVAINVLHSRDLRIELVNDLFIEIWGKNVSAESVIGKTLTEVNPEFIGQPFMERLDEVYTTGIAYSSNNEKATVTRNGITEVRYYNLIFHALKDHNGDVYGILQIAGDNTKEVLTTQHIQELNEELTTANEELAAGNEELRSLNEEMLVVQEELSKTNSKLVENEERFRAITSSSEILVGIVNKEGIPVYINEAMSRLAGQTLEEFVEGGYANFIHPNDRNGYMNDFMQAFALREEFGGEFRFRSATGDYRVLNSNVMPMFDAADRFTGYLSTLLDITESRENQVRLQELNEELAVVNEELRSTNEELQLVQERLTESNSRISESEERFRNMAESTNMFIGVSNENGEATYFNRVWSDVTGRSNKDLLHFGWADLVHADDIDHTLNAYNEAVTNRTQFVSEFRILTHEGKYIWLLVQGMLRIHPDGSFAGHIGSALDITERRRDDQRKNDFIGMVSHELKTPLTSLSGYLEIVKMDLKESGDHLGAGLLEKAGKQVSKMTTMINGFLNVSRLESGKIQIEKRRFNIAKLVDEAKEETTSMYNSHHFLFEVVEETYVCADWDKIGHVLNNFISNAVKYSSPGSTIHIACVTINGNARVSVKDEGFGIAPEYQARLFERYYRVESKTVQSISGFGIGLYLCAEIVKRNDGHIWVESVPGKGSTFHFSLPVID